MSTTAEEVVFSESDLPRPTAYSYVRFSTPTQILGDSLRRQVQMAEAYAAQHNLRLDKRGYKDMGVSAFKQKNSKTGDLAAFIAAVREGAIAPGSYLLIEQFDRLSRSEITAALGLMLNLVDAGVILVTLVDNRVWDRETVQDMGNLIVSIVLMSRAHEESLAKSRRLKSAWGQKRKLALETGKILTRECPRWLRVSDDRTSFEVLEDRVESIRKVYDMRIGGHGIVSIVNRANKEGWPPPAKGDSWHTSLVGRVLHNRSLLGEYQPGIQDENGKRVIEGDPVLNFYPAVIDEQTFLRAQAVGDRKGAFPGRRDLTYRNFLQGLLRCNCGQSMVRKNKQSTKQPGYARYYCTARNRGLSDCPGVSAPDLEAAVIFVVSRMAPAFFEGTARMDALKVRAEVLEVDVSAARQTRNRYLDAIGNTTTSIPALLTRMAEAETVLEKHEKELAQIRAELADLAGDSDSVFENIALAVKDTGNIDARAALREDLSRIIERVVVHEREGFVQVHLRGNDAPVTHPLRVSGLSIPGIEFTTSPGELPTHDEE